MRSGEFTILQVNDVHGYSGPHAELLWEGDHARFETLGGYARLSGLFCAVREERPGAMLALDNGDTFHGTFPVAQSKGAAFVPLLNRLGLDAMTGHWDFAYGPVHLRALVKRLDYLFLAINCYDTATGALSFPPTRVVERDGIPAHRRRRHRRDHRRQGDAAAFQRGLSDLRWATRSFPATYGGYGVRRMLTSSSCSRTSASRRT